MTQHTERTGSGFITYSTVDAEFMFEGKKTFMEVHSYCGPSFYTLDENECEVWLEPDDTIRWKDLWKVYTDWSGIPEYKLSPEVPYEYTCSCKGKDIILDGNTACGSLHLVGCETLESYLFYWEDTVSAYVPVPDDIDSLISIDSLDQGESQEIKFIRFDMSKEEYDNILVD